MFINILILLALIALVFGLGWLARRAWLGKSGFVKWAGSIFSGLLMLILSLVSIIAIVGMYKFYTPKHTPAPDLQVEGTPEQIARGKHLTGAFCAACHSTTGDLPLSGGVDLSKDLPINLGSFVPPNLTPAGPLQNYTDGEIFRALRENVNENGERLVFMGGTNVRNISDEDIKAIIAFLRSQGAVQNDTPNPPDKANFTALLLFGAGLFPDRDLIVGEITAPQKATTVEYGKFMISYLDCTSCHGDDLSGGTSPIGPKGPSLRIIKGWTEEEFITTLRTGVNPIGDELSDLMPWKATGRLDDEELGALYQYITSLP
ncbi:MAG: c-type cytochrome [Anaerolineales bacterium]